MGKPNLQCILEHNEEYEKASHATNTIHKQSRWNLLRRFQRKHISLDFSGQKEINERARRKFPASSQPAQQFGPRHQEELSLWRNRHWCHPVWSPGSQQSWRQSPLNTKRKTPENSFTNRVVCRRWNHLKKCFWPLYFLLLCRSWPHVVTL